MVLGASDVAPQHQWRGVALLVLALAIGAGRAMGAAAGARRGAASGERLAVSSAEPEAIVFAADAATFDAVTDPSRGVAASGVEQLGLQPENVPCNDDAGNYLAAMFRPRATDITAP